jgi:hypothetical protein
MTVESISREQETNRIWKVHAFFYRLIGGLVLLGIGIRIGNLWFDGDSSYATNLYAGIISVMVTLWVLDWLEQQRGERQRTQKLREQLARDAGITSKETDKKAARRLRKHGGLRSDNRLLTGESLFGANLQQEDLLWMNLQRAIVANADLQRALSFGAKLQQAIIATADLQGANLWDTKFDENAILPDGSKWTPDTNLSNLGAIVESPKQP